VTRSGSSSSNQRVPVLEFDSQPFRSVESPDRRVIDDDDEIRRVQEVGADGFEAMEEGKYGAEAGLDEVSLLCFLLGLEFLGEAPS